MDSNHYWNSAFLELYSRFLILQAKIYRFPIPGARTRRCERECSLYLHFWHSFCICIILSIDLLFLIIVSVNLILVISSKNYPKWQKGFFYRYHYWNQMCNCYKRFTIMFNTFLNPLYTKMAPRMTCSFHCFTPSPSIFLTPTSQHFYSKALCLHYTR